jgi:hypothetical protein
MVATPGIIAWALNGYRFKRDRKKLRRVVGDTYGLTDRCVDDLLTGTVPHEIEGDAVVFEYEEGQYRR